MAAIFTIDMEMMDGCGVLVLRDNAFESEALIAPELGANCFAFNIIKDGKKYEIIEPPPTVDTLKTSPSGFGCPILFPFPNRIKNGTFSFNGQTFQFDRRPGMEHSIHGLVYTRPWKVHAEDVKNSASVTLRFNSQEYPDVMRQFPFPFVADLRYSLKGRELIVDFQVENTGTRRMPMGYGIHPYFRVPISPETNPEKCLVRVPARSVWELKDFIPTGRILPVTDEIDYRTPRPIAGARLDDVYTDVIYEDDMSRCLIDDTEARLRLVVESERIFRELVVYTPPRGGAICFEPYTCPTDAPNLTARGLDVGMIVLEPGEKFKGEIRFKVEEY